MQLINIDRLQKLFLTQNLKIDFNRKVDDIVKFDCSDCDNNQSVSVDRTVNDVRILSIQFLSCVLIGRSSAICHCSISKKIACKFTLGILQKLELRQLILVLNSVRVSSFYTLPIRGEFRKGRTKILSPRLFSDFRRPLWQRFCHRCRSWSPTCYYLIDMYVIIYKYRFMKQY